LHCENPNPALEATRFRPIRRVEAWNSPGNRRRAGVNAFGFGGINAHIVLESPERKSRRSFQPKPGNVRETIWAHAANDSSSLLAALKQSSLPPGRVGPCRLALLDPTPERVARASSIVSRGVPWRGHDDIWFAPVGLSSSGGKLALLFPGLDAAFQPRLEDVARCFDLAPPVHPATEHVGEASVVVIAVNRFLHRVISELGVLPDVVAGHSIGEWSAMIASGMISEAAVDAFVSGFQPVNVDLPSIVYAAAGCDAREAANLIQGLADIFVSHDNCPHQVILCGSESSVEVACSRLRAAGVLCQKLRFRSGFHSPLLNKYLGPFQISRERFPLQPPRIPLWSATICAPYPSDPTAIRALMIDHLVQPVRFRELIEALHDQGVRIFLQVGSGSLPGFVDDTLRNRPHLVIASNIAQRSGLAQLRRVAAALFVEGLNVEWNRLDPEPSLQPVAELSSRPLKLALGLPLVKLDAPARLESAHPLLGAFETNLQGIATAHVEVRRAWEQAHSPRATTIAPRPLSQRRVLSVDTVPELLDHCLFPQGPHCRSLLERYPVVPMATSIALLLDAARPLAPERTAVSIEKVRSYRWLAVAPPVGVEITARLDGSDCAATAIKDYVEGTVRLADTYPQAPPPAMPPLSGERPPFVTPSQLYRDGWMFHGPAFQGIVELGPLGQDGITGTIETGRAPGALLDNAGQLLGYWVMASGNVDSLAMPIGVERIDFYGPEPGVGIRVLCDVRIRKLDSVSVGADMELSVDGRLWAKVVGWEDRRLQTDDRLWPVLRDPGKHLLAVVQHDGSTYFHDIYRQAASRDFLARRFLSEAEREAYLAVGPQRQRQWLAGRVAAKDAVRAWLWNHGYGPIYPAEIEIFSDPNGLPLVRGSFAADLQIAIAHKDDIAVAMVAESSPASIDIGRIAAFESAARSKEYAASV
jgi:acyl transferase domain-containing protein